LEAGRQWAVAQGCRPRGHAEQSLADQQPTTRVAACRRGAWTAGGAVEADHPAADVIRWLLSLGIWIRRRVVVNGKPKQKHGLIIFLLDLCLWTLKLLGVKVLLSQWLGPRPQGL
jgi:hypothetical protein